MGVPWSVRGPWWHLTLGALHAFLAFDARHHPGLSGTPPAGPVQAQTTAWSCGAAACVTLLRAHGIRSTEREMGELCLTYAGRGTTVPRFLRGLRLKLEKEGSPLRVRAADGLSPEALAAFPKPCLVGLKLNPVLGHAAVLLERAPDGRYLMGDPLDGKPVLYDAEEFEKRFTGEAIALE